MRLINKLILTLTRVELLHVRIVSRGNKYEGAVFSKSCLEALSVDDRGSGLVVFLLRDPHLLEGGERGEDGATDPDGVLSLWGSDDLDLHGGWGEGGDFLLHSIGNTGVP